MILHDVFWLSNKLLKACGGRLVEALVVIATGIFTLGSFPPWWWHAKVVVLMNPGKTAAQQKMAGAWRPIALLSCVGKVLEAIVAERVALVAEEHGLLPEGLMWKRKGRSTEFAIMVMTDTVHTAWELGAIASILLLDLKGAFDRVNHRWLLHTLWEKRLPQRLLQWFESFLTNRRESLLFDGKSSREFQMLTGVPQGSPLSPILFLIFIATVYVLEVSRVTCG